MRDCRSIGRAKSARAGAVISRGPDTRGGSVHLRMGHKGAVISRALAFIGLLLSALPASATGLPKTGINRSSETPPQVDPRASTLEEGAELERGHLRRRLSLTLGLLDLQEQLAKQERNRAEALARELASARQEIARLEASATATTAVAEK